VASTGTAATARLRIRCIRDLPLLIRIGVI
jgi:hypothetical protein